MLHNAGLLSCYQVTCDILFLRRCYFLRDNRNVVLLKFLRQFICQKTTIKSGIANKTDVIVPNPVKLRPYRTFAEIEQPQSSYVFRIQDSDRGPSFNLVEADGGLWKNATMKKIKDYLAYELAEELEKYQITIIA